MSNYKITETDNFHELSSFFNSSGMGVAIEERAPERVIKMWRMQDSDTGELMAASTFEVRDGVYCLGDIAVRGDLQKKGYGHIMQDVVFEEAVKHGATEIWACAKEPLFYKKLGWVVMDWDSSPEIAVYCSSCGKRGTLCHPEIMKHTL